MLADKKLLFYAMLWFALAAWCGFACVVLAFVGSSATVRQLGDVARVGIWLVCTSSAILTLVSGFTFAAEGVTCCRDWAQTNKETVARLSRTTRFVAGVALRCGVVVWLVLTVIVAFLMEVAIINSQHGLLVRIVLITTWCTIFGCIFNVTQEHVRYVIKWYRTAKAKLNKETRCRPEH